LSLFSLCCLRISTKLRSGAVDKMAGIFTKHIWQPCICQPNELQRAIRKKTGWPNGGQVKIWGAMAHPGPPVESPLFTSNFNFARKWNDWRWCSFARLHCMLAVACRGEGERGAGHGWPNFVQSGGAQVHVKKKLW